MINHEKRKNGNFSGAFGEVSSSEDRPAVRVETSDFAVVRYLFSFNTLVLEIKIKCILLLFALRVYLIYRKTTENECFQQENLYESTWIPRPEYDYRLLGPIERLRHNNNLIVAKVAKLEDVSKDNDKVIIKY